MGKINSTSYGATETALWLVGKIPPKTLGSCHQASEGRSCTHSYDEVIDLLIQLAMERKNDSRMDKYPHKHLRREVPTERITVGRPSQPKPDEGKGRRGQEKGLGGSSCMVKKRRKR